MTGLCDLIELARKQAAGLQELSKDLLVTLDQVALAADFQEGQAVKIRENKRKIFEALHETFGPIDNSPRGEQEAKQIALKEWPSQLMVSIHEMSLQLNMTKSFRVPDLFASVVELKPISSKVGRQKEFDFTSLKGGLEGLSFGEILKVTSEESQSIKGIKGYYNSVKGKHLDVDRDTFMTSALEALEEAYVTKPVGGLLEISVLVQYVISAWLDERFFLLDDTLIYCNNRQLDKRGKYYAGIAITTLQSAEPDCEGRLLLSLFLLGLSCSILAQTQTQGSQVDLTSPILKERGVGGELNEFLSFWSVAIVALFGCSLDPARMIYLAWPNHIIGLGASLGISPETKSSVGAAAFFLSKLRAELRRQDCYRDASQ